MSISEHKHVSDAVSPPVRAVWRELGNGDSALVWLDDRVYEGDDGHYRKCRTLKNSGGAPGGDRRRALVD